MRCTILWEDFTYQIENKNTKKGNAMYYPRFTKIIFNFVMAKDPSIPRRNKVNWHYARDDPMFTTINVISRNEDTQLYGAILPAELTSEDIRNSESYKEYYAIASGKIPPKTKTSKKKVDSDAPTKIPVLMLYLDIMLKLPLYFDYRLKALEDNFSEFKQTNQYAEALSSIPGIVDQYLANKMKEAVDVAVQLKSDRIREEAQAENQQFLDSIDEGMKKEAKTSHAVAANLSELELKKILIDKMEANKSISRPRDGADDDQEPSAGTDRGSKRRRSGKEPESTSAPREKTTTTAGKTTTGSKTHKQSASQSAPVEETMQSTDVFEAPAHQEFETGVHDEQPEEEVHPLPDWFQQPKRLPSPDRAWNKSVPADHESVQPWLSNLARRQDPRESFDELTDTTFDFSAFVMNRLNVTTLTPELLAGPTFELMKGTCKSLTELEYFCEEVYKATTKKLDWINPEGRQYPHDLRKPLPLVPNSQGRHLRRPRLQITSNKWIEDLVPNSMWSQVIVNYDKFALWGISHWGKKRRQFYAFAATRESARDVYSKRRIIAVTNKRDDDILYKFKEGDFHRLRIQDIEDMLLLLVQGKLTNLNVEERLAFNVSLRMFTRSVVIQRRVEDLQLGVESYQKKLNLTKPDT
ncbi:hypothetical protein Tco_0232397 [Tanacetum coccineum]